jgi:SHS2 domain-containing protein
MPALLVEWLQELVYLADTAGLVPERITGMALEAGPGEEPSLEATVEGPVGVARPLVKAVTYHRVELRESNGSWRARATFDV